jgi:hypothetical protein
VKKIGWFSREETASFKRSAFGRFRENRAIFSFGDAAGGLSLIRFFRPSERNECPRGERTPCFSYRRKLAIPGSGIKKCSEMQQNAAPPKREAVPLHRDHKQTVLTKKERRKQCFTTDYCKTS